MAIKQFKLREIAANFNLKSKDISDILVSYGLPAKNTTAALESPDLDLIFEFLTRQNQVADLDVYMYAPKTKKPEPEKTEAEAADKADIKEEVKENPKEEIKKEVKEAPKEEIKPEIKPEIKEDIKETKAPEKPKTAAAPQQKNQPQQRRPNDQSQPQRKERDFSNPAFGKDGRTGKNPRNDRNEKKPQRPGPDFRNPQKPPRTGEKVGIISSDSIKVTAGVKNESAKIVDTRTTSVDLSKYNENLDTFVPEPGKGRGAPSADNNRSKPPKPPAYQRGRPYERDKSGRPIDKEKLALEKLRKTQQEKGQEKAKKKQLSIILPEKILPSLLASKLQITSAEVVKKLFMLGLKVNVNEEIDYDTAALAAMEFGAKVEKEVVVTIEDKLFDDFADPEEKLAPRAPVVVVMGHVDHGKTSLLDAIKHTNVTAGEAGGITQHIGAYRVEVNGREITFLDTPGHAAFTAMRARGARCTDIAILVVAADDGIMPQTVEAINHAKAANVSIIVAINKMDKPQADPDRIKQDLTKYELVPEEWGGDIVCVPVSAITGLGIDELLEMILLTADMKELKANPDRAAQGVVIEAKLDKGKGPVATVLVQNGTLKSGDIVIAGMAVGRVRAMNSDRGKNMKSAGPSMPAEIIGLSETPNAGDMFRVVADEKMARELVEQRKSEDKEEHFKSSSGITLEALFSQVKSGVKELGIIIKADVQGSVEALRASLLKESTEEVKINAIHSAVGGITESDILLASASSAIVVGFNVRPDKAAIDAAERRGVDVRTYRVIYECIEEINAAMKGMLAPKFKEVLLGHAQVRQIIRVPNVGTIAGSYVQDGKITRNSQIRVVRDGIVIFEDKISSLRRFKDDVREVAQGFECGIGLEKFNDIQESDILESFVIEQIKE